LRRPKRVGAWTPKRSWTRLNSARKKEPIISKGLIRGQQTVLKNRPLLEFEKSNFCFSHQFEFILLKHFIFTSSALKDEKATEREQLMLATHSISPCAV
jgi:hypothetical protein